MTIEEAREYWCRRLERAEGYSDEHWDAEERHAHADYVDAMTHAITALAICREHEENEASENERCEIWKLCNEIEDIACDISQQTMNDIVSAESRMIFDKAKEITAETTAPPKSNGDRIRQMTDEKLAESIGLACKRCAYCAGNKCTGQEKECADGNLKWLKQEVSKDAGND